MYPVYVLTNHSNSNSESSGYEDYRLHEWKPSIISPFPGSLISEKPGYIKNWLYHFPRFFYGGRKYLVYYLTYQNETVCQCILTPFSYRFPFMGKDDWQFGLVYTSPKHRNKKLANYMIKQVLSNFRSGVNFWWITEIDNLPSRRLAERIGFKFFKHAVKKGFSLLSCYQCMETEDSPGFSSNE